MPISALRQNPQPGKPGRPVLALRGANWSRYRTTPNGTEAEIRAVYARDDPRYVGGNETDLRNEQTTL